MTGSSSSPLKKSKKTTTIILVAVILAVTGIIFTELYILGYIGHPYEPQYIDLAPEDLGSAQKLEGRTAMVIIFAGDSKGKWDFTDAECVKRRSDFLDYTRIAADWLTEQGKKYGKELEFCYPTDENDPLLYYEYDFGDIYLYENFSTVLANSVAYNEWGFISENIDSEKIKNTLGCKNIVYYFYLNYHEDNDQHSLMLMAVTKPLEKPYEIVWIPYQVGDIFKEPISIAHETLHLFGAPDLYKGNLGSNTYFVPKEFVDYSDAHYHNDIMFVTGGIKGRTRCYDRIEAEITEITAYYIGWTDKAPREVDDFRMRHSQFEKKPE